MSGRRPEETGKPGAVARRILKVAPSLTCAIRFEPEHSRNRRRSATQWRHASTFSIGRCGDSEFYSAIVILLHRSRQVKLGERYLLCPSFGKVVQRAADDGVVLDIQFPAIFENQH